MTLIEDVRKLQVDVREAEREQDVLKADIATLKEQISGERGLSSAINSNTREIRGLRKWAQWLAALIVTSSLGFAFSVLVFIP